MSTTPPGWYPDPWRQAPLRWWDGAQWTPSLSVPTAPQRSAGRPPVPTDAPIYGPWIWINALLPLVTIATFVLMASDLGPLFDAVREQLRRPVQSDSHIVFVNTFSIFGPGYFAALLLSLLAYAASVLTALADYRRLLAVGVVRPFHWAWGFVFPVYPIGRSVVVRKVAQGRGVAPAVVAVVTLIVVYTAGAIWLATMFVGLFAGLDLSPAISDFDSGSWS